MPGRGGPPTPFRPVDAAYRERLLNQVAAVRAALASQLEITKAGPVRVEILPAAAAKSHRPHTLFSVRTCPIVGAGRLGELYIKASFAGLDRLAAVIETHESAQMIKELSCVERIVALSPEERRRGRSAAEVARHSPRAGGGFVTRVSLFHLGPGGDQGPLVDHFELVCAGHGIGLDQGGYPTGTLTYAARCRDTEDVEALSRIIGVRAVSHMPLIRLIRLQAVNLQPLPALPGRDPAATDLPAVVVVDGGISDGIAVLNTWVLGREQRVDLGYRNPGHGTFVAGLICWGQTLNPIVAGLDDAPCAVYDLQLVPNGDPAAGATLELTEREFLAGLEVAMRQHANRFKVWNLSLGTDCRCSLDEYSRLAEALDDLQEQYQVTCVIAGGNYLTRPLLDYPRTGEQEEVGRITTPGDSLLGITVGSISHVDYKCNGPRADHPSPYSRHGAGPNFTIKPDLVHYGGACNQDLDHVHGVRSVTVDGVAEDLGTSFAAPLVARTLAQIYHQITPTPSPVLARALLTHHATDPRTGGRVPDGDEHVLGFGRPAAAPDCLECTPYSATLVFEDTLRPGYCLEWDDFPWPPALQHGDRYFGELWMTVACAPARGHRWGSEYCEARVEAHLGVYREHRSQGKVTYKFTGLVAPEHRNHGLLHHAYPIERLRQWAPIRTYHGDLGQRGQRGQRWRLMVRLFSRHEEDEDVGRRRPQPFALVITIADPQRQAPVYDEMARVLHNRFQAQNLVVRSGVRVRSQTET